MILYVMLSSCVNPSRYALNKIYIKIKELNTINMVSGLVSDFLVIMEIQFLCCLNKIQEAIEMQVKQFFDSQSDLIKLID